MSENKKLGQEPAFANVAFDSVGNFIHVEEDGHYGMNKRFYAACAAMQGMISGRELSLSQEEAAMIAGQSFQFADELLKQESL